MKIYAYNRIVSKRVGLVFVQNNLHSLFILADYLLDSIDPTVNPCEDFYHFACGTWLKNARIPEESQLIPSYSHAMTRIFFSSWCTKYFQSFG